MVEDQYSSNIQSLYCKVPESTDLNLPIAVDFRLNTIISQMKSNIRMLIIVRAWRRRIQYCDSSRTHRWKNNVNMNNDAH